VAGSLAGAVGAHVEPIASALERAADGEVGPRDGDALRGLGYLTLDEGAARAVEEGLHDWATGRPGASGEADLSVVAVVQGAFVAAREYGQRLAYALHGFEQQAAAELKERRWEAVTTILTLPVSPSRRLGRVLGSDPFDAVLDYAAMVVDCDGTWDNGVDDGPRFGRGDAVRAVLRSLPHEGGETEMLATRGAVAYDGILGALGSPVPPTSPVRDYVGPLLGGLPGLSGGALGSLVPDAELVPGVAHDLNQRIDDFLHD
jgi:hypothetical protein